MTIGYWRTEATDALRAGADAMQPGQLVPAGDIYAVAAARSDVYTRLARLTSLLLGGPPVGEVASRTVATDLLLARVPDATRLYGGLRGAGLLKQEFPPAPAEVGEAASRLRRAADAIGVIGDILASHVTPFRRPQTQEGLQIRARGGVAGGLADVGGLVIEAIAVDRRLPDWLGGAGQHPEMDFHPLSRSANWAVNSQLQAAARAVEAAGAGRPRLLDELDLTRQPLEQPATPATVDEAAAAINASRRWLWQHPDQIGVAHLQLVSQLGLALHSLVDVPDSPARSRWREVAAMVADLRGVSPTDTARDVAGEVREVLHWLHGHHDQGEAADQHAELQPLAARMPVLASTLHRGLDRALQAKNVFLPDTLLQKPAGSLIYRAVERWRPATRFDDLIRDLSRSLWLLADPETAAPAPPSAVDASARRARTDAPSTARSGPRPHR